MHSETEVTSAHIVLSVSLMRQSVAAIATALGPNLERLDAMATILEDLVREVQETRDVTGSAIALIQGLKAALDAAIAAGDMSAVAAAVAELDAGQAELAAAITANTPSTA